MLELEPEIWVPDPQPCIPRLQHDFGQIFVDAYAVLRRVGPHCLLDLLSAYGACPQGSRTLQATANVAARYEDNVSSAIQADLRGEMVQTSC